MSARKLAVLLMAACVIAAAAQSPSKSRFRIIAPERSYAPADHSADEWQSLGDAVMIEGILLPIYGVNETQRLCVRVDSCTTTPGLYRVEAPYSELDLRGLPLTYADSLATPMYIQMVNDSLFYIEDFHTGLTDTDQLDGGEVRVVSQASSLIDLNGLDKVLRSVPECLGVLANGIFSFPTPSFELNGKTLYAINVAIGDTSTGYYRGNMNGRFQLRLPGAADTDVELRGYSNCVDDCEFSFAINAGADVAHLYMSDLPGHVEASAENAARVAASGTEVHRSLTTLTVGKPATSSEPYTVMIAGTDSAGRITGWDAAYVYTVNGDDSQWKRWGNGQYDDDIVSCIYPIPAGYTYMVEVERHRTIAGYYRLLNPYQRWEYGLFNEHDKGHAHYMYVHAEDPDRVWLEESPIGVDMGDGVIVAHSYAGWMMANGSTADEVTKAGMWGRVRDGYVTFPAGALLARTLKKNPLTYSPVNLYEEFRLKLPVLGADHVLAEPDSAEAVTYDLLGRRVEPTERGMYIERRGGSSRVVRR